VAVYSTFGEVLAMARSEAGLSPDPAIGVGALARHKQIVNRVYQDLYQKHDWSHLRYTAPRIPINAGQLFYDLPASINPNRPIEVMVWWGEQPYPLDPGIQFPERLAYRAANRVDPAQRYDLRATSAGVTQIELWPTPAGNNTELEITGTRAAPKLVNTADIVLLDDHLVALSAAAVMARPTNKDRADELTFSANQYFQTIRGNDRLPQTDGASAIRLGVPDTVRGLAKGRVVVRIGR
jgi:hypothetical protein